MAEWGQGKEFIGGRKNVFAGLPYWRYLPSGHSLRLKGETARPA
jgi:hypothetical protein